MPEMPGSPLLLELDLTEVSGRARRRRSVGRLRNRNRRQLRPTLRALYEAGDDPRVVGLIAKVGGALPWASMQELRLGVTRLRRQRQADGRLGGDLRGRGQPGRVHPGLGVRGDLAAARRRDRAARRRGGDHLPPRRAGQAGGGAADRAAARVQERGRRAHPHRDDPGAPGGAGAADRLRCSTTRSPRSPPTGELDAGRVRELIDAAPLLASRGPRGRAGRPARLPGRGVRGAAVPGARQGGAAVRRPVAVRAGGRTGRGVGKDTWPWSRPAAGSPRAGPGAGRSDARSAATRSARSCGRRWRTSRPGPWCCTSTRPAARPWRRR